MKYTLAYFDRKLTFGDSVPVIQFTKFYLCSTTTIEYGIKFGRTWKTMISMLTPLMLTILWAKSILTAGVPSIGLKALENKNGLQKENV